MLFSPRDYVLSPAFPGYAVVQIHKSPEGLSPSFVTDYETWEEAGSPDAAHKANQLVKLFLQEYHEPAMDESHKAELVEFVERRAAEGGVAVDY